MTAVGMVMTKAPVPNFAAPHVYGFFGLLGIISEASASAGSDDNSLPPASSSRRIRRSPGASTPMRTMPGPIRTTVMEILSPIRIFSPGFRDKTSINFAQPRPAISPGGV